MPSYPTPLFLHLCRGSSTISWTYPKLRLVCRRCQKNFPRFLSSADKNNSIEKLKNPQFESRKKDKIVTVPNFLCLLRITSTPLVSYLIVTQNYRFACTAFLLIGFTDFLDGFIARKFPSQASRIGTIIDPLADKIFISTTFLTLTYVNLIPVPLALVVVARDLLLIVAAVNVRFKTLEPPLTMRKIFNTSNNSITVSPSNISKINTFLQIATVTGSLVSVLLDVSNHSALNFLYLLTGATTVWSGIQYAFRSGITFQK